MTRLLLSLAMALLLLPTNLLAGPLARIYIAPQDVGLVTAAKQQFSIVGEDADGNEVAPGTVTWSAAAGSGSITSAGLFTAGSTAGKYYSAVTASVPGFSATANVEVYASQQQGGYTLERSIGTLSAGRYDSPMDIAFDGSGNAYVLSQYACAINKSDSAGNFLMQTKLGFTPGATTFLGVSSNGTMYVADPAAYLIRRYDALGNFVNQWGSHGTGNSQFEELTDMCVDSTGQVYVADAASDRIQVFNSSGGFVRSWITQVHSYGYNSPPAAIAVDSSNCLWAAVAASGGGDELQKYDSQGNLLSHCTIWPISTRGSFPMAVDSGGCVYQAYADTITKFTKVSGDYFESTTWGGFGQDNGLFDGAAGIAVDAANKVYVADKGNDRIQIFDSTGAFVSAWSSSGSAKGQLKYPSGIAVDSQGNFYVSDTGNYRVQEFASNGGLVRSLASKQQLDSAFAIPSGLLVDSQNNIYVADCLSNRILAYSSSGAPISNWPLPASIDSTVPSPMGLARSASNNSFYVVDANRNYIQTLDLTGSFLGTWLTAGTGSGQVQSPAGIALDSHPYEYISDYGNNRIQKFNSGGYLTQWGTIGVGNGQFQGPAGICADSGDNIYVADTGNCRVQKFSSAGAYLAQLGSSGFGAFQFTDPEAVAVDSQGSLYVADTGNHRVLKFNKVAVLSVAITAPTGGSTYTTGHSWVDLGGTASSAVTVSWTNNRGGSGVCTGLASWSAPGVPLKTGQNVITITARDASGATVTDTITVTTVAPTITISSPTTCASYLTTSPTVNVSGTALDDVGVSRVSWSNDRGGSGDCTGTTNWSKTAITLQPGRNLLTLTARDYAGNTCPATLLVFYATTSPTTISELKQDPSGGDAYLTDQTVTAVFADSIYIEQSNRGSAIKVMLPSPMCAISIGGTVDVGGTLTTGPDGERCLDGAVKIKS